MYINKQTLFYVKSTSRNSICLFDLKTLTKLHFRTRNKALKFCKIFNEKECINEILRNTPHLGTYIYLDTNTKTSRHRLVNILSNNSIQYVSSMKLVDLTQKNEIDNITLGNNEKLRITWVVPPTKESFKIEIAKLHEDFINSSKLLGRDRAFDYTIISNYVIQTASKDRVEVVVPDFVTSICDLLYAYPKILKISDSVRFIGADVMGVDTQVMGGNNIEYIGDSDRAVAAHPNTKNTTLLEVRVPRR